VSDAPLSTRAVAFDLDGTLVDSVADIATAVNLTLRERDLPALPKAVVQSFIGEGARTLMQRALAGRGDTDEALGRFRVHYQAHLLDETRVYDGVLDVLAGLAGRARVVVCTNKPRAFALPIVRALLGDLVELVLGPEDAGAHKPAPDMLLAAAARTAPLSAYVGDSEVDAQTAHNAGVPFIGVAWGLDPAMATRPSTTVVTDAAALGRALAASFAPR
jgi:phosphoglycolate phosphatase